MVKNFSPTSPVISSTILNTQILSRNIKNAAEARLNKTVQRSNSSPNIIAQGRVTRPAAGSSNTLAATVSHYSPAPGRNLARTMHLEIQNTTGPQTNQVVNAIQRYLDIRPRRQPTADPLDEASIARHPQQIIQSAQRWRDERYNQFTKNGLAAYQFQPTHRTWGGRLELTLQNEGQTDISATASRSPLGLSSPLGRPVTHDPAFAAQSAMGQIRALAEAPEMPTQRVGPPMMTDNPYFDSAYAARNTIRDIRRNLSGSGKEALKVGPLNMADNPDNHPTVAGRNAMRGMAATVSAPRREYMEVGSGNYVDNPANDPAFSGRNAMREIAATVNTPRREYMEVGSGNYIDNPANDPAYAAENAMGHTRENMGRSGREPQIYWPPNQVDDVLSRPDMVWKAAGQTTNGLIKADGVRGGAFSADYRPLAYDQAYMRAMRVMDDINKIFPGARALDDRA